ncbi:uncharacterized protein Hap1MRO34_019746 [Clarias gariepinus]|uniref:cytoskeleton-associated protein 2 n=1 Tax=Clarias gariepinus TaxID=13013 RepID=UPI00234D4CD4|nr:cytoskeleton-associated protein 2 [Clarias gariepinus]
MDTAVKKSNKENSKPEVGPKTTVIISKQKLTRPEPLRAKNDPRAEPAGDKVQVKPSKPAKSSAPDATQRKTLSQTFRTEQTLRHRKLVLETQKPPSSVPPKPALPGTYKGRVVQSKIDCFRKPSSGHVTKPSENKSRAETAGRAKPATTLYASSRAGIRSGVESRTKSGPDAQGNVQQTLPQTRIQNKPPARTATVSTKPSTVSTKPSTVSTKPSTVSTKPSTVSRKPVTMSARPPTVTSFIKKKEPSTMSARPPRVTSFIKKKEPSTGSARPGTVTSFIKKKEPSKPAAVSEQKPQKSVTNGISQYRVRVESAEERRARLAEWLASKGKSLKRPAMTEKSVSQSSKPQLADCGEEAQAKARERVETETVRDTKQIEVPKGKAAFSSSPSHILNITLDLLDNSDTELSAEPEIRMESLVMNLCERLEAMETPSSCKSHVTAAGNGEVKVEEETREYEILEEEEIKDASGVEKKEVKQEEEEDEEEEKKKLKHEAEEKKLWFENDDDEEEEMDSTAADVMDACVVKYSVKTTPFLQSVKKRMEGEMAPGTPGSRCKNSIKELKFLTPVRRSSRIHRNSSRLPGMLNEHDPCVSSLAELEVLDGDDSNAYIYRKNPALLQHLPDQHPESQSSE